jgi:hypothetical protein
MRIGGLFVRSRIAQKWPYLGFEVINMKREGNCRYGKIEYGTLQKVCGNWRGSGGLGFDRLGHNRDERQDRYGYRARIARKSWFMSRVSWDSFFGIILNCVLK